LQKGVDQTLDIVLDQVIDEWVMPNSLCSCSVIHNACGKVSGLWITVFHGMNKFGIIDLESESVEMPWWENGFPEMTDIAVRLRPAELRRGYRSMVLGKDTLALRV
jgi:hypothetical protein